MLSFLFLKQTYDIDFIFKTLDYFTIVKRIAKKINKTNERTQPKF